MSSDNMLHKRNFVLTQMLKN